MKRTVKNLGVVAVVVAISLIVLQIPVFAGFHGIGWGGGPLKKMIEALGLSDDQKMQIKEIIKTHKPAIQPLRQQFVMERRALRDLIQSESWSEDNIKAQVGKVSKIAAELAVQRALIYREVRPILTPEQIQKFTELQKARDIRMDEFLSRSANKTP
jgi:Spy/CpxP family protein refolding chaperone